VRLDQAALAYIGVPFSHQGRNPSVAIDCVGLLVCAMRDLGMPTDADRPTYAKDPAFGVLEAQLAAAFGPPIYGGIPPTEILQPGDVVAIDFKGETRHVGIVGEHANGLSLIHTNFSAQRVTVAHLNDKWRRRIRGVYRMGA